MQISTNASVFQFLRAHCGIQCLSPHQRAVSTQSINSTSQRLCHGGCHQRLHDIVLRRQPRRTRTSNRQSRLLSSENESDEASTEFADGITGYSYLSQHPKEQKPPHPFKIGSHLTAFSCDPPPSSKYKINWYDHARGQVEADIRDLPPLEVCLKHPPAPGRLGTSSVDMTVVGHVKVRSPANSQILKVRASGLQHFGFSRPAIVAAKLYDPLYVDFDECWPDPFHNCDAAFSLESEAYREFLRPVYGRLVPYFYGSYTIDLPIVGMTGRTRPVRAILYEYISGTVLLDAVVENIYSQPQRKEIMRAVINAEARLREIDVQINRDIHPRNVIVESVDEGHRAKLRVIDFGAALCGTLREDEPHWTEGPETKAQIIKRWRDFEDGHASNLRYDFYDLVDWAWDGWLCNEY